MNRNGLLDNIMDIEYIYPGHYAIHAEPVCNTKPVNELSKSNKGITWAKIPLSGLFELATHKGNLSNTDKTILLYMMSRIKNGNRFYDMQIDIADILKLTQPQVSRSIKKLTALGIIHATDEGYYVISSKYIYLYTRRKE